MKLKSDLSNLEEFLPKTYSLEKRLKAKTLFFKKLALKAHQFYGGKIAVIPKAGPMLPAWLSVWYTPGVSSVSTAVRADNAASFALSGRGGRALVLSDSTRVLGDGDCTPPGGLGVMEGKAMLMKYLGGFDAFPVCINSRGADGKPSAEKIIDFAHMVAPTFGAINLEDISQPNCYRVLDELQKTCSIPVWHDDAQGTACVTCAALINALKLARKKINKIKIVLYGAGAANSTVAKYLMLLGANGGDIVMFDSAGTLNKNRTDLKNNPDFYRQWNLCLKTNKNGVKTQEEAFKNADVLIALSKPGPGTIKPEWIKLMAKKAIVFACANPVPEIYPDEVLAAGAFIAGSGRGDFPNQVNNSLCFPGLLKAVLLCRAKAITDTMALASAEAIASCAAAKGLKKEKILPDMYDPEVYPLQVKAVVKQALKEGLAQENITPEEAYKRAKADIKASRRLSGDLYKSGYIKKLPASLISSALKEALKEA